MLAQKQTIIENWPAILHEMKKEYQISDISYKVWLKPLTVHQVDDVRHLVTIITPQEEFRRHINDKYLLPLRVSIGEYTGTEYDVSLILSEEAEKMQKKDQQRKHHGEMQTVFFLFLIRMILPWKIMTR